MSNIKISGMAFFALEKLKREKEVVIQGQNKQNACVKRTVSRQFQVLQFINEMFDIVTSTLFLFI